MRHTDARVVIFQLRYSIKCQYNSQLQMLHESLYKHQLHQEKLAPVLQEDKGELRGHVVGGYGEVQLVKDAEIKFCLGSSIEAAAVVAEESIGDWSVDCEVMMLLLPAAACEESMLLEPE
ncbi:2-oxoglutarate (2OG) and Fe(II)-dependent oxygenase superfamily protein, partial [Striga asiatica]